MITLKVGNSILDADHGALAKQLDCLVDLARGLAPRPELHAGFLEVLDYLRTHFQLEEVVLNGVNYPGLERHCAQHAALLDRLGQAVDVFMAQPEGQPFELVSEFSNALYEHELVEDSDYWDLLRNPDTAPVVRWTDEMVTGHPLVDRHHKAMALHVDHLSQCTTFETRAQFFQSLREFRELAAHHFRVEEELLDSHCSEEVAAAHHGAHMRLLTSLDDMLVRLEAGEVEPEVLVQDFLIYWAADHISHVDVVHLAQI